MTYCDVAPNEYSVILALGLIVRVSLQRD